MEYIVVQECAAGNEECGTSWLETTAFGAEATLEDVFKWKASLPSGCSGRLIVTKARLADPETEAF